MTVTRDVLTGVAGLIQTAGLGVYHADPNDAYAPTDVAITFATLPDGSPFPDRAISIAMVPLTDDISMPLGRVMLQFAFRGQRNNPLDPDDLADPVFDLLQGRTGDVFGNTTVIQMLRFSSVPMGQDATTRNIRADKYYMDLDYAPTPLRPNGGSW